MKAIGGDTEGEFNPILLQGRAWIYNYFIIIFLNTNNNFL